MEKNPKNYDFLKSALTILIKFVQRGLLYTKENEWLVSIKKLLSMIGK